MSSLSAWCDMMDQFLSELEKTFPEEKSVRKYKTSFELLRKANPRKCIDAYMLGCSKYSEKIMSKDPRLFDLLDEPESVLAELNISKLWKSGISDGTKDAIWQYIQTLYILGTTITSIPQDTLDMIEDVANKCATSMMNNPDKKFDEKALMSGMSGLLSSMSTMLGDNKKLGM